MRNSHHTVTYVISPSALYLTATFRNYYNYTTYCYYCTSTQYLILIRRPHSYSTLNIRLYERTTIFKLPPLQFLFWCSDATSY